MALRNDRKTLWPAVLEQRPSEFLRRVRSLRKLTRRVHLDVEDGSLVPGRTVGPATFLRLPLGGQYQLHLMVRDPLPWLTVAEQIRAQALIIHCEIPRAQAHMLHAQQRGFKIWLAINPDTPLSRLPSRIAAHGIMVMGVTPGAQGQTQRSHVFRRLRALRQWHLPLGIDGGVTLEHVGALAAVGVSTFVVGAGITLADNPVRAYRAFQQRLRAA